MLIGIVSDCQDSNAVARIQVRTASLISGASFAKPIGVADDIEAAGNLVDLLHASRGEDGIIMVNVAPRHGSAKRHENGSPFGYFFYGKTLVITTLDGFTLSLAKQLGAITTLYRVDIPAVLAEMVTQSIQVEQAGTWVLDVIASLFGGRKKAAPHLSISPKEGACIAISQFRSFEFVPYLAAWILQGKHFPKEEVNLAEIPSAPKNTVWWIDQISNGEEVIHNCKLTTVVPRGLIDEQQVQLSARGLNRTAPFFHRLKDVPSGMPAIIQGSSGMNGHHFLELVVSGGNAAKHFGVQSGDDLTIEFPNCPTVQRNAVSA